MSEDRAKQLAELVSKVSLQHWIQILKWKYWYFTILQILNDIWNVELKILIFGNAANIGCHIEVRILYVVQTKSAPNPDDMQNIGGDIMKKFAAVVKYKSDNSIQYES